MAAAGAHRVIAIRYGTLASTRSALYFGWDAYGEPDGAQSLDYFFYVLDDGDRLIAVDTGFDPASGTRRGRTCLRAPADAVRDLGIDPREVSHVVVSHLHYDHIGNLDLFPSATILVPAVERSFWTGEVAGRRQFAAHVDQPAISRLIELERDGRVVLYDGRSELVAGVTAIPVGGHSPGQQVFVVQTGGAPVVLASDAVHLYDEWHNERPFGVIADLVEMYEAYGLLRELQRELGATVVPGHDPEVAERFDALSGAPRGLAYAIA